MTYTQDAQQNRKTTAEKGLAEPKPNEVSLATHRRRAGTYRGIPVVGPSPPHPIYTTYEFQIHR